MKRRTFFKRLGIAVGMLALQYTPKKEANLGLITPEQFDKYCATVLRLHKRQIEYLYTSGGCRSGKTVGFADWLEGKYEDTRRV